MLILRPTEFLNILVELGQRALEVLTPRGARCEDLTHYITTLQVGQLQLQLGALESLIVSLAGLGETDQQKEEVESHDLDWTV